MNESHKKNIRNFVSHFWLYSELFWILAVLPLIVAFSIKFIDLSSGQIQTILISVTGITIVQFMICIYFNQKIYSPFVDYLKLVLEEKEVGKEIYVAAQERFTSLPRMHSIQYVLILRMNF